LDEKKTFFKCEWIQRAQLFILGKQHESLAKKCSYRRKVDTGRDCDGFWGH
jgi:hypothetical protein